MGTPSSPLGSGESHTHTHLPLKEPGNPEALAQHWLIPCKEPWNNDGQLSRKMLPNSGSTGSRHDGSPSPSNTAQQLS